MTEAQLHHFATLAMLASAAVALLALRFVAAPYGRHACGGWGPALPARTAWLVMEAPASLGFLIVFLLGPRRADAAPLALLALWQAHYVHRAFVYPFRAKGGRAMPLPVALLGATFNLWNTYINARHVSAFGAYPDAWLLDPRFASGVLLFGLGEYINLRADGVLLRLRTPGETGYKIPRGWLFDHVTSPNYLGEIVAWIGWAVATWSLPGAAFALFTIANLAPRAAKHHAWYRATFPDYPASRRVLVPHVW